MRLAVVGTGYVGLVSGACLAEIGHDVVCVDVDAVKVELLSQGTVSIFEPGLRGLVGRGLESGRLRFTTSLVEAVADREVVFIAVGTPAGDDGAADLSQVFGVTEEMAPALAEGVMVVVKSTVPVGTSAAVEARIREERTDLAFEIGSNPEFLRQGAAVADFMHPDRLVIGTRSYRGEQIMRHVYQPILHEGAPVLFTAVETSELIKYAANSFLATKLAFINEMADLCERVGADVNEVAKGMSLDDRISEKFLAAGPGFGGSCLPKDIQALVHTSSSYGVESRVVGAAIEANQQRRRNIASRLFDALGGLEGRQVAVLGLTFKANTDDVRDSPALEIIEEILRLGAHVVAYDPEGMQNAKGLLNSVDFANDAYGALQGADAAIIATEWAEFGTLDLERVRTALRGDVIVDLRNLYDPRDMADSRLNYYSVGRPPTLVTESVPSPG
jgi:UDPglucose 6-dehydrogenase